MKTNSRKSNFILQGGILGIAGILTRIIGMIYRIPVTNIIGPEGNGYYAAAYQVYTVMLLISSYSLPLAVSRLVSARFSRGEYKNADRLFKSALAFAFATGGGVCILLWFGADFFAVRLMSEPMSAIALKIFAPTLLIVALMGVIRGYFQGMGTMVPTAVSQIIEQIINAIVSILAAGWLVEYGKKVGALLRNESYAAAYGAAGSTLGTSMGALMGLVFLLVMLMYVNADIRSHVRKDKEKSPEGYRSLMYMLVMTVIPVIMSTAIYNVSELISNSMFNKIMIAKGFESTKSYIWGVYSGEYKILLNVPIALSNAMSASVVPALTACMASRDIKGARRRVSQAMRFTMIIAFPCMVGLFVLADPIMHMLFKDGYEMAATMMKIGCINIILYSASTLSNGMLQGLGKMNVPVRNACISLIAHIGILYLLLTRTEFGIYSVIGANFCFALLMSLLNHTAIRRLIKYRQEKLRTFIIPAISAVIMGAVAAFINLLLNKTAGDVVSVVAAMAIGALVYGLVLIRLGGISSREIESLPMGKKIAYLLRIIGVL